MRGISRVLLLTMFLSGLIGCSSAPKVGDNAQPEKVVSAEVSNDEVFEGFFVVPGVNFGHYNKMILSDLNLDDVEITQPKKSRLPSPWILSDAHKQAYRSHYIGAAVTRLIADGRFATALDPGKGVFLLQSSVIQIKPLSGSEPVTGPAAMRPDSEGMATIAIEIYDSVSGELLASLTDSYNLGRMWDETNQSINEAQIRNAFDFWMEYLRQEIDELSTR